MDKATTPDSRLNALRRDLERANAKSIRLCQARADLPPGTSRARVTTANARWARAAEERDRLLRAVEMAEAQLSV